MYYSTDLAPHTYNAHAPLSAQKDEVMPPSSTQQFSGIFISYRRDDSSGHAGRLHDRLVEHFGRDRIFMDVDTIEPGEDFVTVVENAVGSCEILIAVIGRNWLSAGGTGRLDNPNDFVRLEIATALRRNVRVIPVLVQRASIPKPQDLPEDLVKLTRRNAIELSDLRWQSDVDELINVMERVLVKQPEVDQIVETEQERGRIEEVDRRNGLDATRTIARDPSTANKRRHLVFIAGAVLILLLAVAIPIWRSQRDQNSSGNNNQTSAAQPGETTLWKRDDTGDVVQMVRDGNTVRAIMDTPATRAAAHGRRKGDLAFDGSFEGRTLRGTAYLLFSDADVLRCPAFAGDQRFALDLTLSADGNTLSGSREDYELSADCKIVNRTRKRLTYTKASR